MPRLRKFLFYPVAALAFSTCLQANIFNFTFTSGAQSFSVSTLGDINQALNDYTVQGALTYTGNSFGGTLSFVDSPTFGNGGGLVACDGLAVCPDFSVKLTLTLTPGVPIGTSTGTAFVFGGKVASTKLADTAFLNNVSVALPAVGSFTQTVGPISTAGGVSSALFSLQNLDLDQNTNVTFGSLSTTGSVTATPEPRYAVLMLAGLAVLAWFTRKSFVKPAV